MIIESGEPSGRAPGWYPHPSRPDELRHWDGQHWDRTIPRATTAPGRTAGRFPVGWVVVGIITGLVVLTVASCFAMVGVIGGLMNQGL